MNLETIQSRLRDIEQMRQASSQNEAMLTDRSGRMGRNGTDSAESSLSSLSFRFLLALGILAFLIFADYRELPGSSRLLEDAKEAISYQIKLEDMENLEDFWYTISDMLQTLKRE